MTTRIKLTDRDLQTHNGYQWVVGEWRETSGEGDLCGPGWLHGYDHPLLAVLHNPVHAAIDAPLGWEVKVEGRELRDGQMKSGWTRMRLLRQIELPIVNTIQRVAYGIMCAQTVIGDVCPKWSRWAERWLSGEDRSAEALARGRQAAAWAAEAAARAAEAAARAMGAAEAAARAAEAAARAMGAAEAAARAMGAAAWAASAAEWAADGREFDLLSIAQRAMEVK